MVQITFIDPVSQSAHSSCKDEITQRKTDISIQLWNAGKDYDKLIDTLTTKHDKKRLLANIEYKLETIYDIFNTMGTVICKTTLLVMSTQADEVAQKNKP